MRPKKILMILSDYTKPDDSFNDKVKRDKIVQKSRKNENKTPMITDIGREENYWRFGNCQRSGFDFNLIISPPANRLQSVLRHREYTFDTLGLVDSGSVQA